MRLGVFIGDASGLRTDVETLLANAREAEQLGFATGWLPHIPWSLDALTGVALAGQVTTRLELGTAVMPTYPRHPVSMAQQALSAQASCGGRAVLGIGPSHPVVIEGMHGLAYSAPARHTAEYVDVLKLAFHCTGHVSHQGEFFQVEAMLEVPGASDMPVLVAALAPLMLRAAGAKADGTITYWANERAIAEHVVPTIAGAAASAGRPAPRVVAGIPVALVSDVDAAKTRAGTLFAGYNGIAAYQRIQAEGGDTDQSAPPALPDIAIIGDEKTVRDRLHAYADAGATDLAAAVIGLDPDREASMQRTMTLLADLAPELAR
ncbi:MAG TPA: TIGR03564 family F420-dependent LLM class oxidoreductase [Frankiaceae bacterium]|jgi:F420-dependent oxidoreductase-like protein|nr:TIGR03564 family F420-dependent LLM class oxidoreductase [Frankiaceae bacterium]